MQLLDLLSTLPDTEVAGVREAEHRTVLCIAVSYILFTQLVSHIGTYHFHPFSQKGANRDQLRKCWACYSGLKSYSFTRYILCILGPMISLKAAPSHSQLVAGDVWAHVHKQKYPQTAKATRLSVKVTTSFGNIQ